METDEVKALYDLSALPALELEEDMVLTDALDVGFLVPIYGEQVRHLWLSSNGWVSVEKPENANSYALCLPGASLPRGTLAPFWADLDPASGGAIRAGRVASDTYVVSFEAVPIWTRDTPAEERPTFTFQVALHADGEVEFLYGEMGAMPDRWSAGTSTTFERGQGIGCYRKPERLEGRRWRLRNQPSPTDWTRVEPDFLSVLPGRRAEFTVSLGGAAVAPWLDHYEGVVRVTTNDFHRRVLEIPVQVTIEEAPYHISAPFIFVR
jgi:hypothetical protein